MKIVNDVHSQLNKTVVSRILQPDSIEQARQTIVRARLNQQKIAFCGNRHAMGGQQFSSNNILLDTSKLNRTINFEPENFLIEVEAGIKWNELIDWMTNAQTGAANQVGIRQKQTGADDLSLGGALAANIHGRGLTMPPIIADVESFKIIVASGEILTCSRIENAELFRLAIGGYGLFGVIVSIKLRLAARQKLRRKVVIETIENLPSLFAERIRENFLYGDFQFAIAPDSNDFLSKGVFSCYQPVADDAPICDEQRALSPSDWKNLLLLAHTNKSLAFELYAAHYLKTDNQIYWSDSHQLGFYHADYHREIDERTNAKVAGSEMITEVYVPLERLAEFLQTVREDFRQNRTDLVYGTIRIIKRDAESLLAWARADFACVVFNLHVNHDRAGIERAKLEFGLLIDRALDFGGSFYLTYHRWARARQILHCYPQIGEFLDLKKRFDPTELFSSDWYEHLQNELAAFAETNRRRTSATAMRVF